GDGGCRTPGRRPRRGRRVAVPLQPRGLPARVPVVADAFALAVYAFLLAAGAAVVWRRPIAALYVFLVGLAAHNFVMSLLWGAGVRGNSLEAISAWKEALLAVALLRVGYDAWRTRRLPFRPGLVDALAIAFGPIVLLYAVLPPGPPAGELCVQYQPQRALPAADLDVRQPARRGLHVRGCPAARPAETRRRAARRPARGGAALHDLAVGAGRTDRRPGRPGRRTS